MTKTTYHMVQYRRFQRGAGVAAQPSFETMCRTVLDDHGASPQPLWKRAGDRVFSYPVPDARQILLNRVADLKSAVYGEMCLVQGKDLQAIIEMTPSNVQLSDLTTAEIYALSERTAPKGSQFLRGLLYWLAIGDHLFFVKLHSITPTNMQDYFDWFLRRASSGLPHGSSVSFQAEFDPSVVNGDVGDVKSLHIKGTAAPQLRVATTTDEAAPKLTERARRIADSIMESAKAVPVFEAVLGKAKTESLVSSLGPEEYLSADTALKIRGRRTEASRAKVREIATEVAEMTDAQVQIEGKDGILRDGDAILRVKLPFSIPQDGSSLLEFDNVADQLQEVYRRFVADRKIPA